MGTYFIEALKKLKHRGAVEVTAASFQVLSEQCLHSHLPELRNLPGMWMKKLLDRVKEPNQCRDDTIRRSSGLPYGCIAVLKAEPKNGPKTLLMSVMQSLIDILGRPSDDNSWNRIHAFHIIRHIFNDRALAVEAAGALESALQLCLSAMADSVWEVRSAASLCFANLATRMVGYKNKIGNQANQKSISVFEFFFR